MRGAQRLRTFDWSTDSELRSETQHQSFLLADFFERELEGLIMLALTAKMFNVLRKPIKEFSSFYAALLHAHGHAVKFSLSNFKILF